MPRSAIYFLAAVICTATVFGDIVTTIPPSTVPVTQTPAAPTNDPSTKSDPGPTPVITSTEVTPPTENPASNTTSTSTTTTPKTTTTTTTTTTATPPTTTAAPPTPTPAPGPMPAPQQGHWTFVDNSTNVTCVVVQFAAQLEVTYPKEVNKSTVLEQKVLNVPANATVIGGACGNATQWLSIGWVEAAAPNTTNTLTLVFLTNATTRTYQLDQLNVSLAQELFNMSSPVLLRHGVAWQTPAATSYRCEPATALRLASDLANVAGNLTLSRLQEEAFRTAKSDAFSAARECGGADVPDAVPIAVGCALGALVLIVLVAYLVARRRSAARGYLSM